MFVAKASSIHGMGCFVDFLPVIKDDIFHIKTRRAKVVDDKCLWDGDVAYDAIHPFCYINHSEEPNAEIFIVEDGLFFLQLLDDIQPHEEVTIDYGFDPS